MSSHQLAHLRKGELVEVAIDEDGFRGAWYVARVIRSPAKSKKKRRKGFYVLVEYQTLMKMDEDNIGGSRPLREFVHVSFTRPLPPIPPDDETHYSQFQLHQVVDAFDKDGWWKGVIISVLDHQDPCRYVVFFRSTGEVLEFQRSDLRVHFDWSNDEWTRSESNEEDHYHHQQTEKEKELSANCTPPITDTPIDLHLANINAEVGSSVTHSNEKVANCFNPNSSAELPLFPMMKRLKAAEECLSHPKRIMCTGALVDSNAPTGFPGSTTKSGVVICLAAEGAEKRRRKVARLSKEKDTNLKKVGLPRAKKQRSSNCGPMYLSLGWTNQRTRTPRHKFMNKDAPRKDALFVSQINKIFSMEDPSVKNIEIGEPTDVTKRYLADNQPVIALEQHNEAVLVSAHNQCSDASVERTIINMHSVDDHYKDENNQNEVVPQAPAIENHCSEVIEHNEAVPQPPVVDPTIGKARIENDLTLSSEKTLMWQMIESRDFHTGENHCCEVSEHNEVVLQPPAIDTTNGKFPIETELLSSFKKTSLWQMIESRDVFKKMPQNPHFRPLMMQYHDVICVEGLATGYMVTFENVVVKINELQLENPRSDLEEISNVIADLEELGFDISKVQARVHELTQMKDKQQTRDEISKATEEKIIKLKNENEEIKVATCGMDKSHKELVSLIIRLMEHHKLLTLKMKKNTCDFNALQMEMDRLKEDTTIAKDEFSSLAAGSW